MGVKRKIKELSREKRKRRKVNPTILIVCEGKDTEVNYFENFNSRYMRVDVKVAEKKSIGKNKSKKTDPINLVEKAIEYKNTKYDITPEDGDRVWCIMDVDLNYNNPNPQQLRQIEIENAYKKAKFNDIRLGISNPCFELWYLLHFQYTTAHLKNYDAVKDKLEKTTPIKDYEKNKCVYDLLKDKTSIAVKNCKKLKSHHESNGKLLANAEESNLNLNIKSLVESNPYTNIGDLVEYIEDLNKR